MQSAIARRTGGCCCPSSGAGAVAGVASALTARPVVPAPPRVAASSSSSCPRGLSLRPQATAWPLTPPNHHPFCRQGPACCCCRRGAAGGVGPAARAPRAAAANVASVRTSASSASASSASAAGKQQQQQEQEDDADLANEQGDEFEEDDYEDEDEDYGGEQGQGLRAPAAPPPLDAAALQLAVDLARVASATKAADVMVLDVAPLVSWTSYLVIASVASRPQLMAVLARCEQAAAAAGYDKRNTPSGRSQWECVDFGSVVVHVMTPPQREAYALEDFYGAADEVQWWEDGEEEEEGARADEAAAAAAGGGAGGGGSAGVWTTKQ